MTTAYITKISKFTSKDNNTSLQKWLNKVQKAEDANEWNINYEMAIKEANYTKLVNFAIEETSLTAEKKIDQLTKKIENYFTSQQQQQQQPQKY
ncbi:hypothetical protein G9A89_010960 [Geosiphon pyriformis]|nr:hypothetical protein G9A89_010960 [Geosiphon pyriformis]